MDKNYWYFEEGLASSDLRDGFDKVEEADQNQIVDLGATGVNAGFVVSQHTSPNLTVDVSAGVAQDNAGQRVSSAGVLNQSITVDSSNASTNVSLNTKARIVSISVKFLRVLSNTKTDGASLPQQFNQDEGVQIVVTQGPEYTIGIGPAPTDYPALLSDALLVADVTRKHISIQTAIHNADISDVRKEWAFSIVSQSSPNREIHCGRLVDRTYGFTGSVWEHQGNDGALNQIVDFYNAHINGDEDRHVAGAIDVDAGSLSGAENLQNRLDDFESTIVSADGASLLGAAAYSPTPAVFTSLSTGTIRHQLNQMADGIAGSVTAANINYAGGAAWADGTTNSATTVEHQLDKVVTDLNATGAGVDGVTKIGVHDRTNFSGPTLGDALNGIDTNAGFLNEISTWTGAQTFDDITAAGTTKYKLASRVRTRLLTAWNVPVSNSGAWVGGVLGNAGFPFQSLNDGLVGCIIMSFENIPHNATITAITVDIAPASGHTGLPSVTLPRIKLCSVTKTGAETVLFNITDPSGSVVAYEVAHEIVSGSISVNLNKAANQYHLILSGEEGSGTTFKTGLIAYGVQVTFTVTEQDDAAG